MAVGIFLILLIIGLLTHYYINSAFKYNRVYKITNEISHFELELRKAEKDFLHHAAINPLFHETKESQYLHDFERKIDEVKYNISTLESNNFIKHLNLQSNFKDLNQYFDEYSAIFFDLVDATYKKGFKDYGLIGKMRGKIHAVENNIDKYWQDPALQFHMLMLRRHEKDYLLRKDLKYREKFNERIRIFLEILETYPASEERKKKLAELLKEYQQLFLQVIRLDVKIGLDENQGLNKDLNDRIHKIEKSVSRIKTIIDDKSTEKINEAITMLLVVSLFLSAVVALLVLREANHVSKSLRFLQRYILRLGKGELPDRIVAKKRDEIAVMIKSINVLTANLRNTRDFAIEVGKGNLRTKINVFNNEGDLGGSLIEMRNRLSQVAKERKKNELEAERRAWITEGAAKFGQILRQHSDNLDELAFDVLKNLIDYLDVAQGALFIENGDNGDYGNQKYFDLKAGIAYGHRMRIKKRVNIEDNLIGRCIVDKKVLQINKVPDDYMCIASGLGATTTHSILIAPFALYGKVLGVVELGSFGKFKQHQIEFVERIGKDIAITISKVKSSLQTVELLKKTQIQAENLKERQEEIEQQKSQLQHQAERLQDANRILKREKEFTASSIRYAQTIQNAILPTQKQIKSLFSDYFVIYRPKDVVSGDFYWFSHFGNSYTSDNQAKELQIGEKAFVAVVDCTGHGVPGAFMSMIGSSSLNAIVNENQIHEPDMILELLNARIISSLKQDQTELKPGEKANNDGMDVSLCRIERRNEKQYNVVFSGAKQSLYYYSEKSGHLVRLRGDRKSIGGAGKKRNKQDFTNQEIILQKGDMIYLLSDGIIDQHSPQRKKFGSKKLIEILTANVKSDLNEQQNQIKKCLDHHQGNEHQRDDITVFGIKL